MKTEFEVKFYPINKDELRAKLKSIDAVLTLPESLMRISLFGNDLNSNMKVHYIRVRDEIDKVTMSAKIHAREGEGISDQKESMIVVNDFDQAINVLESAGLVKDFDQEKFREVWTLKNTEIVIDTWPELKSLIEIEGESEEKVKEVATFLGFDWSERIVTSITEILAKEKNITFDEAMEYTKKWKFKS